MESVLLWFIFSGIVIWLELLFAYDREEFGREILNICLILKQMDSLFMNLQVLFLGVIKIEFR